jgi:hypothetical protein
MSTVSLTGRDSLIIDGRVILDLADGDNSAITFPNEIMAVKTGKGGNTLYADNATGKQADLSLRIIRGSADDRFLNAKLKQQDRDPAAFPLMSGRFIKRTGNGFGFVTNDTHVLQGGVFFKNVETKSNAEGDTEQSVAVYSLRFGNVVRAIL